MKFNLKIIKIIITIGLIFLWIGLFTPTRVFAQTSGSGCDCGTHGSPAICNVDCNTTVTCGINEVLNRGYCITKTTFNECNGPNSCNGGCCTGGQCTGCEGTTPQGCPAGTSLHWDQAYTYCGPDGRLGETATGNCCKYVNNEDWCRPYNAEMQAAPCVADCTNAAPAAPTLSSPAEGARLSTTDVNLLWNATSWGTACSGANNQYSVYTAWPSTLLATLPAGTTATTFTGMRGTDYAWQVTANNGQLAAASAWRTFRIMYDQIAGTVYNDPNNTCSQATRWSGGGTISDGSYSSSIAGDGTYSMEAPAGASYNLARALPAGYSCSTGVACWAKEVKEESFTISSLVTSRSHYENGPSRHRHSKRLFPRR